MEPIWIQYAVLAVQVVVFGLTYAMLRLLQGYLRDFGAKAGFDKE